MPNRRFGLLLLAAKPSIESSNGAKANMINTFEYFNQLLIEIPQHMDDKDLRFLDDLLPWSPRVQKEYPSKYKKLLYTTADYIAKILKISVMA